MARILHSHSSAPGVDNRPYEIYHAGAHFAAYLIGQACLVAKVSPAAVRQTLGPTIDLSVWIPKKEGADRLNGQRPLQLPSCFGRLVGACLMNVVGPAIQPFWSEYQTAIKVGSCSPNINAVFRHLAHSTAASTGPQHPLWHKALGLAAHACDQVAADLDIPLLHDQPCAVLADQSKTFERLSLRWVFLVMNWWAIPLWAHVALLALISDRWVCAIIAGKMGEMHPLRCGAGMVGPAPPFIWNLSYDPFVVGLACAISAACPTFVDDLCGHTVGPSQAFRLLLFILAAGHAAGLQLTYTLVLGWLVLMGSSRSDRLSSPSLSPLNALLGRTTRASLLKDFLARFC